MLKIMAGKWFIYPYQELVTFVPTNIIGNMIKFIYKPTADTAIDQELVDL
jgi:hypothetical protein